MADSRSNIVAWAKWGVANKPHFNYSEGANRMSALGVWPLKFPINADCSAAVTLWYWLAGAPDPCGGTAYTAHSFGDEGYTGTLLSHDIHISEFIKNAKGVGVDNVQPGDLVVYGPGTGWHVGLIVEVNGPDILTVSHGEQGDPSFVWVNPPVHGNPNHYPVDGRQPQTFLRCSTATVGTVHPVPA